MTDLTPELNNWKDIEQLLSSNLESKREQGMGKALQNVTLGIVNSRQAVSGLRQSLGGVQDKLEELNKNIKNSNESSGDLTKALNRITLVGVSIAFLTLIFEIYRYTYPI